MVSVDELQTAKVADSTLISNIDDLDLAKKQLAVNYVREKDLGSFSYISEDQLKKFEGSNLYVYGVRHHFLRHQEILLLQ